MRPLIVVSTACAYLSISIHPPYVALNWRAASPPWI